MCDCLATDRKAAELLKILNNICESHELNLIYVDTCSDGTKAMVGRTADAEARPGAQNCTSNNYILHLHCLSIIF